VFQCQKSQQSLRTIATGIPKSVHRHLRNIKATKCRVALVGNQGGWRLAETAGICSDLLFHQRGIGSESLSAFFSAASRRANRCSASALRELEVQLTNHRLWTSPSRGASKPIHLGGDETFMVCPFSAMELAIFSEVECENRTYQTWWAQVSEWFNQGNGIVGVSYQRWAKALFKLAGIGMSQSARYVPSPVCLRVIGSAIARQQVQLQKTAPRLTRETQNALISCRHL